MADTHQTPWLVRSLLQAAVPDTPVEMIETHMSWVYLAGDRVFKLKKPVRHSYLDFTSLAARQHFCREEVRLNARLAPQVYLGVSALERQGERYVLADDPGPGDHPDVLDWLVRMRRLPREWMLDHAMARGTVTPKALDAVADRLSRFYANAQPVEIAPSIAMERIRHELLLDRAVLVNPRWVVIGASAAIDRLHSALVQHHHVLDERVLAGHIVEGHGDLRPEHICLTDPPAVIDCIEFNPALRQVDPFDDLAYLALECRVAGHASIGERMLNACAQALGEAPNPVLMHIHTARHALVRARLSLAHLFDDNPRTPERWHPQAQRYVYLALATLDQLDDLTQASRAELAAHAQTPAQMAR